MTIDQQKLTPEQSEALQCYATLHGRNWKSALREAWMTGDYHGFAMGGYLQQIRNTFGPTWLTNYRIPVQGVCVPDEMNSSEKRQMGNCTKCSLPLTESDREMVEKTMFFQHVTCRADYVPPVDPRAMLENAAAYLARTGVIDSEKGSADWLAIVLLETTAAKFAAGEMMLSHAVYHLSHHKVVDRGDWLAVLLLTKPAEYVAEVEK